MLVDIANEQYLNNNEVGIIVINKNVDNTLQDRIATGIKFYRLNRDRSSKSILPVIKLIFLLRTTFKADVIHIHDPKIGKLIRLISRTPLVLTVHNTNMDLNPILGYKKIFAISDTVKSDVESRSNLKCKVIYNGIRIKDIKMKEALNVPDVYKIILVKRLEHRAKGHDLLLKAMDILINKKGIRNIRLCLAGEGISRDYIQELINELKLQEYIFLLGNKSREWVYENLNTYDLFIHPSRFEGFGLTVVEAMAAKVPVIASNIEGPAEILENGRYGLMFEKNNYEDLALRIEDAMRLYENGDIIKIVESAFQHCITNFNITRTAREYCESYL